MKKIIILLAIAFFLVQESNAKNTEKENLALFKKFVVEHILGNKGNFIYTFNADISKGWWTFHKQFNPNNGGPYYQTAVSNISNNKFVDEYGQSAKVINTTTITGLNSLLSSFNNSRQDKIAIYGIVFNDLKISNIQDLESSGWSSKGSFWAIKDKLSNPDGINGFYGQIIEDIRLALNNSAKNFENSIIYTLGKITVSNYQGTVKSFKCDGVSWGTGVLIKENSENINSLVGRNLKAENGLKTSEFSNIFDKVIRAYVQSVQIEIDASDFDVNNLNSQKAKNFYNTAIVLNGITIEQKKLIKRIAKILNQLGDSYSSVCESLTSTQLTSYGISCHTVISSGFDFGGYLSTVTKRLAIKKNINAQIEASSDDCVSIDKILFEAISFFPNIIDELSGASRIKVLKAYYSCLGSSIEGNYISTNINSKNRYSILVDVFSKCPKAQISKLVDELLEKQYGNNGLPFIYLLLNEVNNKVSNAKYLEFVKIIIEFSAKNEKRVKESIKFEKVEDFKKFIVWTENPNCKSYIKYIIDQPDCYNSSTNTFKLKLYSIYNKEPGEDVFQEQLSSPCFGNGASWNFNGSVPPGIILSDPDCIDNLKPMDFLYLSWDGRLVLGPSLFGDNIESNNVIPIPTAVFYSLWKIGLDNQMNQQFKAGLAFITTTLTTVLAPVMPGFFLGEGLLKFKFYNQARNVIFYSNLFSGTTINVLQYDNQISQNVKSFISEVHKYTSYFLLTEGGIQITLGVGKFSFETAYNIALKGGGKVNKFLTAQFIKTFLSAEESINSLMASNVPALNSLGRNLKRVGDYVKNSGESKWGVSFWNAQEFVNFLATFKTKLVSRLQTMVGFSLTHSDTELSVLIKKARELNIQDDIIDDLLLISCRADKRITASELIDQMVYYVDMLKRGYTYRFLSIEQFRSFSEEFRSGLNSIGVSTSDVRIQGSSVRTPYADDVDMVAFISKDEFDAILKAAYYKKIKKNNIEIDIKDYNSTQLKNLSDDITANPSNYNSIAKNDFNYNYTKQIINAKPDKGVIDGLKSLKDRLQTTYPNLNIKNIAVQTSGGLFDLKPFFKL